MLHQDNWTQEVTHSLKKFEKQLIIALKEKGWDGKEDEATVTWTFAGALFYCITVITTIGMVNSCDNNSTFNSIPGRIRAHCPQDAGGEDRDDILRHRGHPDHGHLLVQHRGRHGTRLPVLLLEDLLLRLRQEDQEEAEEDDQPAESVSAAPVMIMMIMMIMMMMKG